ncbi:MAG: Rid family hydrolase [Marinibacterium sp.]
MRQAIIPESLRGAAEATGFSPAVRAGDFLFLTGATGGDVAGQMPVSVREQTENALSKVALVLGAAGRDLSAVVEVTSYHVDLQASFDTVQQVFDVAFGHPLPAWTAVEVAGLRRPGAVVEYRIVAHVPDIPNTGIA